jgi:hypothetical protein
LSGGVAHLAPSCGHARHACATPLKRPPWSGHGRSRLLPRALARSEARHPTAVRAPRSGRGLKPSSPSRFRLRVSETAAKSFLVTEPRPPSQLPPPPAPHRRPTARRPPHRWTPPLLRPAVAVPSLVTRATVERTLPVSFPFPDPPNGLHTSPPTYSTHPYRFTIGNGQHRPAALLTTVVPLSADPVGHGPLAHGCQLVGLGRPMLAQGEQCPYQLP